MEQGTALGELVEELDEHREADGRVEVALRNVEAEALRHQAEADHQEEAQAEHHHSGVGVDEAGQGLEASTITTMAMVTAAIMTPR